MININYQETILSMAQEKDGIITSSEITTAKIPRIYLKIMTDKGLLVRIDRGIYSLPEIWEDEMYTLQCKYKKGIFSHGTALYIHKMSDRTPIKYEMTFPRGYHLKSKNELLKIRCSVNEIYNLGIEKALSPLGRKIKVYNIEKTICDLLKTESDIQITKDAIKMYCNSKNRNITKLTEYAKKLNVESKILTYLKVLL